MIPRVLLLAALMTACAPAIASMTISGTRVIFPGSEKEVLVRTNNKGTTPALVQVWVDDGDTNPNLDNVKTPFVVTPPVYRVEPGKGQSVRMIYNGMALPQDRESLFFFNMLEIPPKAKDADQGQKLELAFRTRIKIFYRPTGIEESSSENERDKLKWEVVSDAQRGIGFKVTNPTAYYFSFDSVIVMSDGRKITLNSDMVPPIGSKVLYPAQKLTGAVSSLEFKLINDYGAVIAEKLVWSAAAGRFIATAKDS
ncbi:fimbria/pilus periplasmic chaperone [Serratia sp. UGAL515B_01]|uniref:fimbria/pilus periplasmic chaperone n=1 Tax=Serratia sp. UGAL515B_01 TaxID=2986763 RepID=UPI002955210B|nr:fimbria/pilus periplasmic chaperone [Serratia sp. UGAL515B_01]WON77480.1 fimbria/pilus periplasmic chaperone [Serratia sp. UGAL515B_01]